MPNILIFGLFLGTALLAQERSSAQQQAEDLTNNVLMDTNAEKAAVAAVAKAATEDATFLTIGIEAKEKYYLGEAPIIKLALTNTSGGERQVYEAEHRQFHLRGEGIFNNGDGKQEIKEFDYEGSFVIPIPQEPKPGERFSWLSPLRRKPTQTTLKLGESTSVEIDFGKRFFTELFFPGKYKLTAITGGNEQKAVKEFEVYFDDEKSTPILAQKLRMDGDIIAFHSLRQYNRPKLIVVLEEMLQSKDETIRQKGDELFSLLRQMDKYEMNKAKQH